MIVIKLKKLQEQRVALIEAMEVEVRDAEDNTRFEELKAQVSEIDTEIRSLEIKNIKSPQVVAEGEKTMEIREDLLAGKEVEMREAEVTTANVGAGIPVDYVTGVVKKATEISPLFALADKMVTASNTAITIQNQKLGKFVPMNELQAYANKVADMSEVTLDAHKYGIMATLSEELIQDASFNAEQEINDQIVEGFAETMDELLVTGDAKVFGIEKATKANGAGEVVVPAKLTVEALLDVYYALKPAYRKNAVWVVSPVQERELAGLVDATGRPMLVASYGVNPTFTILGRPVVVNENATRISFVDMTKAVKVAIRKSLTIKRDDSVGFANDTVAIKGTARIDIKPMLQEAIAYGKVSAK